MTVKPKLKIEAAADVAYTGNRVVRMFASIPCPHCLRGRMHASAVRDIGDGEYAWTCQRCHRDLITVTAN